MKHRTAAKVLKVLRSYLPQSTSVNFRPSSELMSAIRAMEKEVAERRPSSWRSNHYIRVDIDGAEASAMRNFLFRYLEDYKGCDPAVRDPEVIGNLKRWISILEQ